jgi:hypothetical protein
MADGSIEERVFSLEQAVHDQVSLLDLEAVQTALSAQIVQLGAEMRVDFSALREEARSGDRGTRNLIEQKTAELAAADEGIRGLIEQKTAELAAADEGIRGLIERKTAELAAADEGIRGLIEWKTAELAAADEGIRGLIDQKTAELAVADEGIQGLIEQRTADLLAVIAAGDEETRRHARVLHEELIARLDTINGG